VCPSHYSTSSPSATSEFSINELVFALKSVQSGKVPGQDEIYNEYLSHLNKKARATILHFANLIWTTGTMSHCFLQSYVVPIIKPGKPETEPKSYRPIALTSCLSKLVERLVINCLTPELKWHGVLMHWQSGFWTVDLLINVSDIHLGFQKSLHSVPFWPNLISHLLTTELNILIYLIYSKNWGLPPIFAHFYHISFMIAVFKFATTNNLANGLMNPVVPLKVQYHFPFYLTFMWMHWSVMFTQQLKLWTFLHLCLWMIWLFGKLVMIQKSLQLILPTSLKITFNLGCRSSTWSFHLANVNLSILHLLLMIALGPLSLLEVRPCKAQKHLLSKFLVCSLTSISPCVDTSANSSTEVPQKINLLARVANSIFGYSQSDLRSIYIAFIHSGLEYAAPVWFPLLSKTQLKKLATIECKCLRILLSAPHGTPNVDLYFEANLDLLETQLHFLLVSWQKNTANCHMMIHFTLKRTMLCLNYEPNALHDSIFLTKFFLMLVLTQLVMMSINYTLLHSFH